MDLASFFMYVTKLLHRFNEGDREVMDLVIPLVYQELKKLARARLRGEANVPPLETTALVHEVFLKLAGGSHPSYESRSHFYGIASRLMRQILVDAARAKATVKRSGAQVIPLSNLPDVGLRPDRSVLALEDALQWLEKADHLKGRLIEMRYFAGMTAEECSSALSIRVHVVRRELRLAQAWLRKHMAEEKRTMGTVPTETPFESSVQIAC
jgi:RNA polymerase sigma-70 factor, ECF subfamily